MDLLTKDVHHLIFCWEKFGIIVGRHNLLLLQQTLNCFDINELELPCQKSLHFWLLYNKTSIVGLRCDFIWILNLIDNFFCLFLRKGLPFLFSPCEFPWERVFLFEYHFFFYWEFELYFTVVLLKDLEYLLFLFLSLEWTWIIIDSLKGLNFKFRFIIFHDYIFCQKNLCKRP